LDGSGLSYRTGPREIHRQEARVGIAVEPRALWGFSTASLSGHELFGGCELEMSNTQSPRMIGAI